MSAVERDAGGRSFLQGYACAIAILARSFGQDGLAAMIGREGGFSIGDFTKACVDEYDLAVIRTAYERNNA